MQQLARIHPTMWCFESDTGVWDTGNCEHNTGWEYSADTRFLRLLHAGSFPASPPLPKDSWPTTRESCIPEEAFWDLHTSMGLQQW